MRLKPLVLAVRIALRQLALEWRLMYRDAR